MRRHPAELQSKILLIVKTLAGIIVMSGILSMVLIIGSSDIGLISAGELIDQLIGQGTTVLCAGVIWVAAQYIENCRKK